MIGTDEIISSWEFQERHKDYKPLKFDCGFTRLNDLVEGFEVGELIVLSGITKHGKTTLFQALTESFERKEVYSLWFSYEVAARNLIKRFRNLPLFYLPETLKDKSLDYIKRKIKEAKDKYNIKMVFIDHLHYLLDLGRTKNPSLEIGTIIRGLKRMAVELEIVIFLAAHTTKLKTDKAPTAEDIRDSSFVSQESDCVMLLWRSKKDDSISNLKVEFHRRIGLLGKIVKLKYVDGEFRELEDL